MVRRQRCLDEHHQSERLGHRLRAHCRQHSGTGDCHSGGDLYHQRLSEYWMGCQRCGRGLVSGADPYAFCDIRRHGRQSDALRRVVEVPQRLKCHPHDLHGLQCGRDNHLHSGCVLSVASASALWPWGFGSCSAYTRTARGRSYPAWKCRRLAAPRLADRRRVALARATNPAG